MEARCEKCGHDVTCLYHDCGGPSQLVDLFFYACKHCGHKASETQNGGQADNGNDDIACCPFCGNSCIKHRVATREELEQFRQKAAPQS